MQKRGPPNTLNYLIRDVVPKMPRGYRCTMFDIGLVINQLMGSGYIAPYSKTGSGRTNASATSAVSAARRATVKMTNGFLNVANSAAETPVKQITTMGLLDISFQ